MSGKQLKVNIATITEGWDIKPPDKDLSIYCLVGVYPFGTRGITRKLKDCMQAYIKLFAYTQHLECNVGYSKISTSNVFTFSEMKMWYLVFQT